MKFDLIAAYRALEEALPNNEVRIRVSRSSKKIELTFECRIFTGWVDTRWRFYEDYEPDQMNEEFNKMIASLKDRVDDWNKNWPPANRSRKEGDQI